MDFKDLYFTLNAMILVITIILVLTGFYTLSILVICFGGLFNIDIARLLRRKS